MFEYEKIEPVIPGNHVKDWQKIRKQQWKYVKKSLGALNVKPGEAQHIKKTLYLLEAPEFPNNQECSWLPDETIHPGNWLPAPMLGFFLCSDQSEQAWKGIWDSYAQHGSDFDFYRDRFLQYVPHGYGPDENNQDPFGTFGGLEQRMLPYLIQSDVYTDDMFQMGRFEYRKVPWKSPASTFLNIFCDVSCFQYDISEEGTVASESIFFSMRLKNALSDNADAEFHPNHLKAARLLITILEDEGAPQWLRKIWADVRDGKVSG
jgi:hypothetical protein